MPAAQLKCCFSERSPHSLNELSVDPLAMNPEHLELLVTRVMPYGKYKGRLIADLPGHYLNWFASQAFRQGKSADCWR